MTKDFRVVERSTSGPNAFEWIESGLPERFPECFHTIEDAKKFVESRNSANHYSWGYPVYYRVEEI